MIIFKRRGYSLPNICLGVLGSAAALFAIRNFTLFGLIMLPVLSGNIKHLLLSASIQREPQRYPEDDCAGSFQVEEFWRNIVFITVIIFIFLFTLMNNSQNLSFYQPRLGLGLLPEVNKAAEFFKRENLKGPIFNNYDIGGYLIYHLYPGERVFVDNRPEAYPANFFQNVYIPMQEDEKIWQEQDKKYNFNVIFFSHQDVTPWGQKFLIERVKDINWVVIYADQYTIIFLKRNMRNLPLIERYEIPKEFFKTSKIRPVAI